MQPTTPAARTKMDLAVVKSTTMRTTTLKITFQERITMESIRMTIKKGHIELAKKENQTPIE